MKDQNYKKTENLIYRSYARPEISETFRKTLRNNILQTKWEDEHSRNHSKLNLAKLSWGFASSLLVIIILSVLIIGPAKVWAQITKWFAYEPKAGLLSVPGKVMSLQEPIHVSDEYYSIVIQDATLTVDRSSISYLVFKGESLSESNITACNEPAYLTVNDNFKYFETNKGLFPVLPNGTTEARLFLPCVADSLPDESVWHEGILLHFEENKSLIAESEINQASVPIGEGQKGSIHVLQTFVEGNNLVLITELRLNPDEDYYFHISGVPVISDSTSKMVFYESPEGAQMVEGSSGKPLNYHFKFSSVGLQFPIKIAIPVNLSTQPTADLYSGEQFTWVTEWTPNELDLSAESEVCVDSVKTNSLDFPAVQDRLQLLLHMNDGSWVLADGTDNRTVIADGGVYASLSPDGNKIAIVFLDYLKIINLGNRDEHIISGDYVPKFFWDRNSNWLAAQSDNEIVLYSVESSEQKSYTVQNGGQLAGWGKDGSSILFGVPEITGKGYLLREIQLGDGTCHDIFYLDKSATKNNYISISSDTKNVVYLGDKQGTLYVKNLENGHTTQILDVASSTMIDPIAIDSYFWADNSSKLFVELKQSTEKTLSMLLIDIGNCEINSILNNSGLIVGVRMEPK